MPYFGQFGIAGMTVFLTGLALLTFCRLSSEPPHKNSMMFLTAPQSTGLYTGTINKITP